MKVRKSSFIDRKSHSPSNGGGQGGEGILESLTHTPQKKGGRLFCISDYETGNFISFILKTLKELLKVILLLKLPNI